MPVAAIALLVGLGIAAGAASALFGIGGGLVMVPVLHYGLGMDWAHATAVSLLAIAIQTPTGVHAHARRGAVDWRIAGLLAVGGVAGVLVGDWLQPRIDVPWLKMLFAALMLLAAWRLVQKTVTPRTDVRDPAVLLALGVGAGIVSNLLGIGGGLLTVPVLALLGVATHTAVGSSLVPVFTNAALASAVHLARDEPLLDGVWLGLGALVGVPFGARAAHGLADAGLRRVFAVALAIAALAMAWTARPG